MPEKEYPVPKEPALLTQSGCVCAPRILAVRAGQEIRILNPDGLSHNVHILPKVNRERNWSMGTTTDVLVRRFEKEEEVLR